MATAKERYRAILREYGKETPDTVTMTVDQLGKEVKAAERDLRKRITAAGIDESKLDGLDIKQVVSLVIGAEAAMAAGATVTIKTQLGSRPDTPEQGGVYNGVGFSPLAPGETRIAGAVNIPNIPTPEVGGDAAGGRTQPAPRYNLDEFDTVIPTFHTGLTNVIKNINVRLIPAIQNMAQRINIQQAEIADLKAKIKILNDNAGLN